MFRRDGSDRSSSSREEARDCPELRRCYGELQPYHGQCSLEPNPEVEHSGRLATFRDSGPSFQTQSGTSLVARYCACAGYSMAIKGFPLLLSMRRTEATFTNLLVTEAVGAGRAGPARGTEDVIRPTALSSEPPERRWLEAFGQTGALPGLLLSLGLRNQRPRRGLFPHPQDASPSKVSFARRLQTILGTLETLAVFPSGHLNLAVTH